MSADARVARAIQQVRAQQATRPAMPFEVAAWLAAYTSAVDDLIDEAKDALHLTDDDIAQH